MTEGPRTYDSGDSEKGGGKGGRGKVYRRVYSDRTRIYWEAPSYSANRVLTVIG